MTANVFKCGDRLVFKVLNDVLLWKSEASDSKQSPTSTPEKTIPKSIPRDNIAETTAMTTVVIAVSN